MECGRRAIILVASESLSQKPQLIRLDSKFEGNVVTAKFKSPTIEFQRGEKNFCYMVMNSFYSLVMVVIMCNMVILKDFL